MAVVNFLWAKIIYYSLYPLKLLRTYSLEILDLLNRVISKGFKLLKYLHVPGNIVNAPCGINHVIHVIIP